MNVFAFPVSIIVLWICVSSSQTIILVKTCMHVWSFLKKSVMSVQCSKRTACLTGKGMGIVNLPELSNLLVFFLFFFFFTFSFSN